MAKKSNKPPVKLPEPAEEVEGKVPLMDRVGFSKTKRFKEDKYIRIKETATKEEFIKMGKAVASKEIEWSFYAVDGGVGYHYYLVKSRT